MTCQPIRTDARAIGNSGRSGKSASVAAHSFGRPAVADRVGVMGDSYRLAETTPTA
jgi:quinolinate synthase